MNEIKFQIGQVVATPGALATLEKSGTTAVLDLVDRHMRGDWGDVDDEDKRLNDRAITGPKESQNRVLSAYNLPTGERVWIITEWDRSVTTVLLPKEY